MSRLRIRLLFGVFVVAFAVWRLAGLSIGTEFPSIEHRRRPQDPVVKREIPSAVSFQWKRPLFSRPLLQKPDPVSLKAADDIITQPPTLVGVVADGENRLAILELKGRLLRSQQGMTVGPWRILEISPHSITVENNQETKILDLNHKYLPK